MITCAFTEATKVKWGRKLVRDRMQRALAIEPTPKKSVTRENWSCSYCGCPGHYVSNCPTARAHRIANASRLGLGS